VEIPGCITVKVQQLDVRDVGRVGLGWLELFESVWARQPQVPSTAFRTGSATAFLTMGLREAPHRMILLFLSFVSMNIGTV
jgi:hypothetical protein